MICPTLAPLFDEGRAVPVANLCTKAVFRNFSHREHDMRVRFGLAVFANIPMDIKIGDHAFLDKLGFDERAR